MVSCAWFIVCVYTHLPPLGVMYYELWCSEWLRGIFLEHRLLDAAINQSIKNNFILVLTNKFSQVKKKKSTKKSKVFDRVERAKVGGRV